MRFTRWRAVWPAHSAAGDRTPMTVVPSEQAESQMSEYYAGLYWQIAQCGRRERTNKAVEEWTSRPEADIGSPACAAGLLAVHARPGDVF